MDFNGLDLVVLVALGVAAFTCSWASSRAAAITDQEAERDAHGRRIALQMESWRFPARQDDR